MKISSIIEQVLVAEIISELHQRSEIKVRSILQDRPHTRVDDDGLIFSREVAIAFLNIQWKHKIPNLV